MGLALLNRTMNLIGSGEPFGVRSKRDRLAHQGREELAIRKRLRAGLDRRRGLLLAALQLLARRFELGPGGVDGGAHVAAELGGVLRTGRAEGLGGVGHLERRRRCALFLAGLVERGGEAGGGGAGGGGGVHHRLQGRLGRRIELAERRGRGRRGQALGIAEAEVERRVGLVERTDRSGHLGAFGLHLGRQRLVLGDVALDSHSSPWRKCESGILTLFMPSASRRTAATWLAAQ